MKYSIPEDELREMYIDKEMYKKDIAEYFDCSSWVIDDRLTRYGIKQRQYEVDLTKEELVDLYLHQDLSSGEIAELKDCGQTTVARKLHEYGIEIKDKKINLSKEKLYDLYFVQKKTQPEIAEIIGCHESTIQGYMRKYNFDGRKYSFIDKNKLKYLLEEKQVTIKEVSEMMGLHPVTISRCAKRNNIKFQRDSWNGREDEILKKMYPSKPKEEILNNLNRTWAACIGRAHILGIKRDFIWWTKEEENKLKNIYLDNSWDFLLKEFPDCTKTAIRAKANELGMVKVPNWTKEEDEILIKHYELDDKETMLEKIDRSWLAIKIRAAKIGLTRKWNYWTEKEIKLLQKICKTEQWDKLESDLDRSLSGIIFKSQELGLYKKISKSKIIQEFSRRNAEYEKWRIDVFEKDNYKCALTGEKNDIVAHHLNGYDDFPEQRTEINNGITLCKRIHICFHKKYGFGNNTKEQFNEFKNKYLNGEFNKQPKLVV